MARHSFTGTDSIRATTLCMGDRLTTREMATFVANGYLRFDAVVPEEINEAAVEEMARLGAERLAPDGAKPPHTGTPLDECYPPPSAIGDYLRLPRVRGIVHSLVGEHPVFDHDWTHHLPAGSTGSRTASPWSGWR